jgi:hypothetical protein
MRGMVLMTLALLIGAPTLAPASTPVACVSCVTTEQHVPVGSRSGSRTGDEEAMTEDDSKINKDVDLVIPRSGPAETLGNGKISSIENA